MSLAKNFFIQENSEVKTSDIIAEIAIFYAKNYVNQVYVIRNSKLDEVPEIYRTTNRQILKKIIFMYPKKFETLLKIILDITKCDNPLIGSDIPKVLIIESLHNWCPANYTVNLALDLSPIIASLQNAIDFCSRKLKVPCYSFVTSKINYIPNVILDLYYYKYPIIDIAEKDRIKAIQESPPEDSQI